MTLNPLRLARLQLGLPLWEVARRAGISESCLSRIERERIKPSGEVLAKISQALGLPAPGTDNPRHETSDSHDAG